MFIIICTIFASSSYDILVVKFAQFCIPGSRGKVWPAEIAGSSQDVGSVLPLAWTSNQNGKPRTGWHQPISAQLYSYDAMKINYRL